MDWKSYQKNNFLQKNQIGNHILFLIYKEAISNKAVYKSSQPSDQLINAVYCKASLN